MQYCLGLQGGDKRSTQVEQERSLQIGVARLGNQSSFLSAGQPQLAFVIAFVQIAEARHHVGPGERLPDALVGNNLRPVCRYSEGGIGTQIRGDLLRLRFIDVELVGLQGWIGSFKLLLNLLPGEALLGVRCRGETG